MLLPTLSFHEGMSTVHKPNYDFCLHAGAANLMTVADVLLLRGVL